MRGHRKRSGGIEARIGLRMMPTFPRSSLSFRTAGFRRYGWKAGISDGAFLKWPERLSLLPTYAPCPPVCIHRSCTSWSNANPAQCRVADSIVHRHEVGSPLPQGPRSCPSYVVSGQHHLADPIRPARRHIAISPHGGLYAMPSLCGSA